MDKRPQWKPGTMIYPIPAVIVSCGDFDNSNLITIGWTGTICTEPAMCYISVRPSRYSYELIRKNMEFTINLTNESLARAADWCGVRSGRDYDKWKEMNLTKGKGIAVSCPYIVESPLAIECRVRRIVSLGSHDMFLADVMSVLPDSRYISPETDAFDLKAAGLISYSHGRYFCQGEEIGRFGWTVKKR